MPAPPDRPAAEAPAQRDTPHALVQRDAPHGLVQRDTPHALVQRDACDALVQRDARDALARAEALLAQGEVALARPWLERAIRLAPGDATLRAMLAGALIGHDDARAAALFAALAETVDIREIWLGLAGAEARCRRFPAAGAALARLLSRHVANDAALALAFALIPRLDAPGFCAIARDAKAAAPALVLAPANPRAAITVRLDDRVLDLPGKGEVPSRLALPPFWRTARRLTVTADSVPLCASPIDIAALTRVEGFVAADGSGGLQGWAWHPGDPDADPRLCLRDGAGVARRFQARLAGPAAGVLARPRGFKLAGAALAGLRPPVAVTDAQGTALAGSPLDPAPARRARRPAGPPRRIPRRRPVCIVLAVQDGAADTLACLTSVLAARPEDGRVVVIDDAAGDAALAAALDALATQRAIRLIRHATPHGSSASINRGLALAGGCDVLVLHGDTVLPPDAIERLRQVAYTAAAIGSVTPFASDAAALRYPATAAPNPMPDAAETARLAGLAWRANKAGSVDLPLGEGFCLYLRHDCLAASGRLRATIFAEGDGAVGDLCLRAASAGWRHVAATGVFIAHRGEAWPATPARQAVRAHGAAQIAALYPGHAARLAAFAAADPLAPARRAFDLARWRASSLPPRAPLLVLTHGDGGGVDAAVAAMLARAAARGQGAIVLRPAADGAVLLDRGDGSVWPDLRFAMPGDWPALRRLLRAAHPAGLEIHHTLGHHPGLAARLATLGLPYRVHVHDYALVCPRIAFVDGEGRYCGEPAAEGCAACLATHGSLNGESIAVPALRARSAGLLRGAAAVTTPSADAAARMRRHFPGIAIRAAPPERDGPPDAAAIAAARARAVPGRVCVIGAIGMHKGFDVLAACARDAAARDLHLNFIVVGHTIDDAALLDTGRVFITGPYDRAEAVMRIAEQNAALAFLPSVGPETWAYTLSEAWRAGLAAAVFDLGAPAARIRRHGHGLVLPRGLQAAAINSALIAAMAAPPLVPAALSGDE